MRKTKIVCTLGPATDEAGVLEDMIECGMDVARMNFSHGDHDIHKKRIDRIKELRRTLNKPISIMLDTKGPEIRIGTFESGRVFLRPGQQFELCTNPCSGNEYSVFVNYPHLPDSVSVGNKILFADGLIESEVIKFESGKVTVVIKNGGYLSGRKSINLPETDLRMPYMSESDMSDIRFGLENDIDYIAASFVRNADDIKDLRRFIRSECPKSNVRIISKIENEEGVSNISEIIDESDGVMIARGDMGVEIEFELLPEIQKRIIKQCLGKGKISITATQMLESMIENPRPTRAEVSDIANAIYDGTSAIMLSGETAAGKYPQISVGTMARIAETTEKSINYKKRFTSFEFARTSVTDAISHAVIMTAVDLNASAILAVTRSGHTAYSVSGLRPFCPVYAITQSEKVYHELSLSWGVTPVLCNTKNGDRFIESLEEVKNLGKLRKGETVAVTGNSSESGGATTNTLRVYTV